LHIQLSPAAAAAAAPRTAAAVLLLRPHSPTWLLLQQLCVCADAPFVAALLDLDLAAGNACCQLLCCALTITSLLVLLLLLLLHKQRCTSTWPLMLALPTCRTPSLAA
jgi:hypothetical protein